MTIEKIWPLCLLVAVVALCAVFYQRCSTPAPEYVSVMPAEAAEAQARMDCKNDANGSFRLCSEQRSIEDNICLSKFEAELKFCEEKIVVPVCAEATH